MGEALRYILRQTTTMMLSITVALTLAIWLSQCLNYLGLIVAHGLPLGLSFEFLALLLPSLLILILPVATFIATAFVYQKLMLDRELVVLRACGLSQLTLARPALILAFAVMLVCYSLTLYFVPLSVRAFRDFEHSFVTSYGQFLVQEGVFTSAGPGVTIYVRERDDEGNLRGVLIRDARDANDPVSYTAALGRLEPTEEGLRVTMQDGTYQARDKSNGNLSILNFEETAIDVGTGMQASGQRQRLPEELFVHQLLDPSLAIRQSIPTGTLRAIAHTNLALPLYAMAFTVVGLALVLNGGIQRYDRAWRIGAAILAVLLLEILAVSLRNLAGKNPPLLPVMYAAPLLPTLLGLAAMAHADGSLRWRVPRLRTPPRLIEQPQAG